MRVSTFSRSSVIAISGFAVVFLLAMYQVAHTLSANRAHLAEYQQLKSLTTVDFYRTIANYLQTGEASLLNTAESHLDQISQSAKRLGIAELEQAIAEKTASLKKDSTEKYRALGKLSGNPMAILRNSEQSMSAINASLARYALESDALTTQQRLDYLMLNEKIASSITEVILARETLFDGQHVSFNNINPITKQLKVDSEQLRLFPLLGIYEQNDEDDLLDDDDLLLDDDESNTDLSEEAIDELISLVARYAGELSSTLDQQIKRQQGLNALNTSVQAMENIILDGETAIIEEQEQINNRITWTVILLMSILVIFLAANYWLTRTVVLKPLRQLRDSFVVLVEEGPC